MSSTVRSLQDELKKNQATIKELNKQHKEVEHETDKAKIDLEIAEDKANDIEIMMKQHAHYIDKTQQLEKQITEQEGENNRLTQMKELDEKQRIKHEQEMKNIRQKQEIEANKIAAELKEVEDETKILMTKNKAMYEYMTSKEFINPLDYLPNAYVKKMKEQEKEELMKKWTVLSKENMRIKE